MNGGDSKNPGYAATIASPPSLSKPPKGYGCPIIQARTTTHNGMPAVIFEVKDYYRFMAEEYKLTIVDASLAFANKSLYLQCWDEGLELCFCEENFAFVN
ncbi:PREDICTED: uncharacterized protein LOC109214314 isoform X3 [Nicotiana attenuata]|uniref:uncharacterized protein LOC109214314 isoform X3 n=1 Tax=Nicotiana attenuata TaxID=49451 RepID=UPI000904A25A|nr:PREDICTED: uncharacterized protein LOC109214314 isoform X3 [Nicotiana attenuata]